MLQRVRLAQSNQFLINWQCPVDDNSYESPAVKGRRLDLIGGFDHLVTPLSSDIDHL